LASYPRERLLVLFSEELYREPAQTHGRALEFLGLPAAPLDAYPRYTRQASGAAMTAGARRRLTDEFRPHNERLAALLGRDPGWGD
jgi:hypothetical protein